MADGKWITGLTPETPVEEAARLVLTVRFEVVRRYLPLAAEKPYEDSEYVHQLRVGTRRAGAALKVFGDYLPKKHLKAAKKSLRTLRRAAGGARDWDVFVENLPAARPLTTAAGKPALDFLLGYAIGERSAAQTRLVDAAAEAGPTFAEESTALPDRVREGRGDSPEETFGGLAHKHLDALFAEFTAAAQADPTDPADLHQLRIRAKRLRYAIEIFAECFAPPLKEHLYPAVEGVQELLGETQDAAVGVRRLDQLRELTSLVIPEEWKRLRRGVQGLVRGLTAKLKAGRAKFQEWREEWEKLVAEYPLDSLRLVPELVGESPA
ncbi:MAG: hypothetical protein JWO38_5329 [Gemmataceae bacterium]|nr:hypothetical protein [Gemmataceae bacterium]